MTLLLYLLKVTLLSAAFYGYYRLFLQDRQFHRYNRYYLLLATTLALIIPLLNIPLDLRPPSDNSSNLVRTFISLGKWEEEAPAAKEAYVSSQYFSWPTITGLLYAAGIMAIGFAFLRSLIYIIRIRRKYAFIQVADIRLYQTTEPGAPFSFFRSIFWDRDMPLNTTQGTQIFRHEWYHTRKGHSLDILFMELVCCAGWINPFFHLIKKELQAIHEFLADEYALAHQDRTSYATLLVTQAIHQKQSDLTHPFSQHQIKRRIMMILNSPFRSTTGRFSRIMALPLLLMLFSAFSFRFTSAGKHTPAPRITGRPVKVVIDAAHGGIDPGAVSQGHSEKEIALILTQKINELAPQYNVQPIMTRTTDELPGHAATIREGLYNRVALADDQKADLFVSVHVNFSGENPAPAYGFEAYISGRRADPGSAALAGTVLAQLKSIYTTSADIKQRQAPGIVVLDKTHCPAMVLECGFINRPEDLQFITDKGNQEKIARSILEGVVRYWQAASPESH